MVLILAASLVSCGSIEPSSDQTKEILENLRSRIYETAPIDDETVYWVKGGSVYHLYRDCKFLARSEDVRYGTAYYSGRTKVCETCAKRAEESEEMTQIGTDTDIMNDDLRLESGSTGSETEAPETEIKSIETDTEEIHTETGSVDQREDSETSISSETTDTVERTVPENNDTTSVNNGEYSNETVYWTPGGSVWHVDRNCSALARSTDIRSGTIAQSGKSRACKRCSPQG